MLLWPYPPSTTKRLLFLEQTPTNDVDFHKNQVSQKSPPKKIGSDQDEPV